MGMDQMGMGPAGGGASSMPGNDMFGDMNGGMDGMDDPMGDMNGGMSDDMGGNEPDMGSKPFGDTGAEMSSDPEKKIESLVGQAASIIRKDLNGDGIEKHEDKKKEVLGMLASAVIDGMDGEQRSGMIDYLSDKLQGKGESEGDTDGGSEDHSLEPDDENGSEFSPEDDGMGQDDMMGGQSMQQMMESAIHDVIREMTGGIHARKVKTTSRIDKENTQGYSSTPFKR